MFRKILVLMLAVGVIASLIGVASALFTDSQAVDNNTFTTGTLDISTNPTSMLVSFENMAPGDQITAPITVSNAGSLALRYALAATATNTDGKNLDSQLGLTIKSGVTDCSTSGFATDGTVLYGSGPVGATTALNLIGNPATGADTGDRELDSGSNETLCFNVKLPSNTLNGYEGASTTATFTFYAEQVANN